MKKLLLAAAVAALSTVAAQAAPTVYGKAFLTIDLNDGDTDRTTVITDATGATTTTTGSTSNKSRSQLNSNSSRIGFKGSEALSANTDLVYQLEYGIDVDADKGRNFKSRDTYLGLSNKQFGTVLAGRLTAIDDMVNYADVTAGGVLNVDGGNGDGILASFDAPRANNAIAYVSPNYNGLNFLGMYVLDENNNSDTLGRDAFGLGAKYETDAFNAGATYIQAGDFKVARVSGSYNITPAITAGALYQVTDDGDEKENALTLSGEYKVAQTPWTAYTQLDLVDNLENVKDNEAQRVVVGGKYAFNKNTTGHIYGAYLKKETSETRTNAAGTAVAYSKDKFDGIGIGAGIEYKF